MCKISKKRKLEKKKKKKNEQIFWYYGVAFVPIHFWSVTNISSYLSIPVGTIDLQAPHFGLQIHMEH